jgi:hypothetical protein
MEVRIQGGEISGIIRNQIRGFEPNLLPLGDFSTICIYGTDTNDRMARTSKRNIMQLCRRFLWGAIG